MLKFYEKGCGTFYNTDRLIPAINKFGFVTPAEVLLRLFPDIQNNLQFVLFYTNEMYMLKKNFSQPELFTLNKANYVLFDDKNVILGISDSFEQMQYFNQEFVSNIA